MQDLRELEAVKDELEAHLDFIASDSMLQLKVHIDKYNEEYLRRVQAEEKLQLILSKFENTDANLKDFKSKLESTAKELSETQDTSKEQHKRIQKYQKTYHDVDIGVIH